MSANRTIAVVGDGPTAGVVAACLASVGHHIVLVRLNHPRLEGLEIDPAPDFEPGLTELLQDQQRVGRLVFGTNVGAATRRTGSTFLCIDGQSDPFNGSGSESLVTAVRSIGNAATRDHLVVVTTTAPMGDGSWLGSIIKEAFVENADGALLVSNPSLMRPGRAVSDFLNPEQVVIGSDDSDALDRVTEIFGSILEQSHAGGSPQRKPDLIRTDLGTAEAIKRTLGWSVGSGEAAGNGQGPSVGRFDQGFVLPSSGSGAAANGWGGNGERGPNGNGFTSPNGNGATPAITQQGASERTGTGADVLPKWKRTQRPRGATSNPTVTVVIPTLNEAENIPHVLSRLPESVNEVVIVDGRSTDDTVDVARELLPDCVVVLEERPGKGVALRSGFEAATSDIVVMLDADGSTDPREIPAFVGMLEVGADFVKGSRFVQGGGTDDMEHHRKLGNKVLTMMVNIGFGGRYSDLCYGYNAMWRDAIPAMDLDADGFEIETLMGIRALRAGLEIAEVPSFECRRIVGTSNLRVVRDGFRILRTIIRERLRPFRRPEVTGQVGKAVDSASSGPPPEIALEAELTRN